MLTRLRVHGFKNLVNADIRFGPFTCIAGANGVGKSNLFDAITFLSALADRPLIDAALSVRDEAGRTTDVRSLFFRTGTQYTEEMAFEAEMIVPMVGLDDLGQEARASSTFLRYTVKLAHRTDDSLRSLGSLELLKEELVQVGARESDPLPFPHDRAWRKSAVKRRGSLSPFIATEGMGSQRVIKQYQEGRQGRPLTRPAVNLPRTVLSVANAAENPTTLLARNELRSWRLLQLEPSSLRRPDEFTAPTKLSADGAHLAAALYHLARTAARSAPGGIAPDEAETAVYARVANRLADLIDDVYGVSIDLDEKRELLTLLVTGNDRTAHPARALSDGTLRFLALSVLAEEPDAHGLLCLEEPENGIHPARIPAMLRLLQDLTTDVTEPVGPDNPLRQVIVNTHSPSVVKQVPEDSLVVAELGTVVRDNRAYKNCVRFRGLADTWRQKASQEPGVPLGTLLAYLSPDEPAQNGESPDGMEPRRVMDRKEIQPLLFPRSANA